MAADSREVLLTVHAHVRPDGRLCGTVGDAGAGAAQGFEGWLELLATLCRLLGPPQAAAGTTGCGLRNAGTAAQD
ncbi:MAG TPA: hypothetical protein VHF91_03645 [Acidimicrobiales bacterium]|nr:hypothetical protein [Acidimicrobiales bacterium]